MTRKGGARITGGGGSSNNPTPKCQQRQQLQPQNHPQPQEGIMSEYAIAAENQRDLEESYAELGLDQPRVIDRSSDQIKRDKNIIDAKMRGRQTRVEVSSGSADLPQRGSERHWFTTFLLLNRYLLISLFSVAGFICIATDSGVTQGYTDHSTSINKNVIIACLVLLFIIGGSVFSAMGGGEMWPESDNGDGDEENQATNQTTPPGGRKRCFSVFRCVPIPFSPIRTGLNSAQSAVRAGLNSAQSLFRPNSSNEPIRTKAELEKLLKKYDNNLFKVLLGHKISDVSLLGELADWRKKKILLSSGLDGTKDLIKLAKGIHEFFLQAEAKSLDPEFLKILVLLHFPPNGQNLDETGVLYTGDEQIPINPTTNELVYLATIVLMGQFRMEPDVALIVAMNSTVVTSVIPITLPHDAGSAPTVTGKPTAGDQARIEAHNNYITKRDVSEAASKLHIDHLAKKYKFTYAIVFGSYPWKFYNKHLKGLGSFKNIKVMQKFALIHLSALRDNKKSSKRQAFEASFYLSATFSALAEKPVLDITLDGPQFVINQYILKQRGAGRGEHFYGAWYNGNLVLLGHSAEELKSQIDKEVSSLPSSRNNLKRRWGRSTSSEFPKTEDLVARLSGETTNQEKTISYYHLDIGVFYWEDCLKDELPEGSLRDYGLPPRGERNTYQNITMGVQNDAVLGNWGAYVEAKAPVQQTRNSLMVARTSASLTAAADDEDDEEDVDDDGW